MRLIIYDYQFLPTLNLNIVLKKRRSEKGIYRVSSLSKIDI